MLAEGPDSLIRINQTARPFENAAGSNLDFKQHGIGFIDKAAGVDERSLSIANRVQGTDTHTANPL
jgi:hypothetical protein